MKLDLLFEKPDLPRFDLPSALVDDYGGGRGLGFARPSVVANFVASVDGVVALPRRDESGHVISKGSAADRFVMGMLRACADVVLVGAGTFRKAAQDLFTADAIYPDAASLFAEARATLGLARQPKFAVVSASGDIDATGPALANAFVFTSSEGASKLRGRLPAGASVVTLCEHAKEPFRAADAIAHLHGAGASVVLTEGGPTFFTELAAARLVDELFLTTSPALFGRFGGDARKSLADGIDLGGYDLELLSVRRHASHLFTRWALAKS